MKRILIRTTIFLVILGWILPIYAQTHRFPQAGKIKYYGPALSISQPKQNQAVISFYEHWKKRYLKQSSFDKSEYKISINKHNFTVSEAMGYGMMIVVQMAGYDLEARKYFDGLNRYRKRFPSKFNKAFMCWEVRNDKKTRPNDSATDGDCNIAAALLVASIQWNDKRYAEEAAVIIEAVERDLIRKDYSLRLGDWDSDEEKHQACRPSDFATADFLLFYRFTGERIWLKVRDKSHTILAELQRNYAPQTGLVPDFAIRKKDGSWEPAFSKFMETRHDGDYHYNSCRVPWRIGCDALLNNSAESKVFCTRLSNWTTSAIPEIKDFKGGYKLSGKPLVNYDEPVYTAPIAVAAMAAGNVRYAQDGYEFVKSYKVDYFSDTINLFSLMVLTHNFWLPDNFALR